MQAFVKYVIASAIGLGVDYTTVLMAINTGISYKIALLLGLVTGGVLGFTLLTFWVFPTQKNSLSMQRIASYLVGLLLTYGLRVTLMYVWYELAQDAFVEIFDFLALLGTYGVSCIMNFIFQKFFYTKK